jgi:DAK2 domain fusion protein YloV
VLDQLDAGAIRRWCAAGLDGLRRHQYEIDEINVYPVPDGDTGTNLVMTVSSAQRALAAEPDAGTAEGEATRLGRVLRCMARGALLGARGNSGVILSQFLRGIADALAAAPCARGREVAAALAAAADAGYGAVADPVEGTVLTVARAAASGAAEADTDDLLTVVRAAADAADEALRRTPEMLPVLAQGGVVDAGGYGLVVFLRALVEVVSGARSASLPLAVTARDPRQLVVEREGGSAEYGYEVQYLLDAEESAVDQLKQTLSGFGDSLVVVGTGGPPGEPQTFNVHVHVNDVGAAVEAGVRAGRPHRISVSRFADQAAARTEPAPDSRGVVVVCSGPGLAGLFSGEGAVVVDGGATHNPSTAEILAAIRRTAAAQVVLLPNDSNVQAVCDAAAREVLQEGVTVRVVHTRASVQALAALAVKDAGRPFDDDVIAMAEAAGACRYAELTVATREALTMAGRCQPGDVLALLEGEVTLIGSKLADTGRDLLDRMLSGGGELVTLVIGADAPEDLADVLTDHLRDTWPFVETQVYDGGQPHYPLLVGVE